MTALLELEGIVVAPGGRTILALEQLSIAPGETLAILGANGAGKSTLLRIAGGPPRPRPRARAPARPPGHAAAAPPRQRRGAATAVAATRQRARERRDRPALQARRRARAPSSRRRNGSSDSASNDVADRPAAALSGGEAQRVSLARALALTPELLLLDEPFGALDSPTRAELLADLRDILATSSTASLLVTHDPHEAAAVADRVLILHAGDVRQIGPASAVLDHPADSECARVLGFENVLSPTLATRLLGRQTRHRVAVRAADCRLDPNGETGTLERTVPLGAVTRAIVTVDDARLFINAPAPAPDWLAALAPDSRVGVRIDEDAARPLETP